MRFRFRLAVYLALTPVAIACEPHSSAQFDYLGQPIPGNTPVAFAPDLISKPGRWEGNAVFSTDGEEFYFNVFEGDKKSIYQMRKEGGAWSEPAPFAALGDENNWEPFITADGRAFYFVSSRPPGSPEWNGRIWRTTKIDQQWLTPVLVDLGYDTDTGYWFPNIAGNGDLYFGGAFPEAGNQGKGDGYVFDAASQTVKNIKPINTEHEEWDPLIAPDGSFIMWASDRPGGFGNTDLYISFRKTSDDASPEFQWGDAINMGPLINTPDYEVAPRLSPDGRFLFFDRPINGVQDIYWVSMEGVLALNPAP